MKKLIFLTFIILLLSITLSIFAVDISEDNTYVIIKTKDYEAYWNKAAQMGYMQVFIGGSKESIVGKAGRAFYHSCEYGGGWHDWGALKEWKTVEKSGAKAVVNYKSNDGASKDYDVTVSYYDTVPYIKHVVKVTNVGNNPITSFQSGHAPMFEVNLETAGMSTATQPFPCVVFWTKSGFYAGLYGPDANEARKHDWGGKPNGRMDLVHDKAGKEIKKGESHSITYYVAFGKGGEKEALALAAKVKEEPPLTAVTPMDSVSTTWSWIKSEY